jgi:hypothetical protein
MVFLSSTFQGVLIVVTAAIFIITSVLIIRKHMRVKYALMWFLLNAVLLLLAIFPQLVQKIANVLHIYSDTNTIFLIMLAILYMLSFSYSIIFSKNSLRIKDLTQEMAILKAELDELKNNNKNDKQ